MAKWADYCISAVRYDDNGDHIDRVRVRPDNGDKLGSPSEWRRSSVVSAIDDGKTFITVTKNTNNKWSRGEDVHVITVDREKYIRTDNNKKESDNLGNLPEF